MIAIENQRTYKGVGIYIGRPSVFGNPIYLDAECMRDQVLLEYETYLKRQLERKRGFYKQFLKLVVQYRTSGSITLICWCDPKPCHGHVLARYIEQYAGIETLL
jgi:hypothetical protein